MTRSARRRWTRELESEVDGLALAASGPVVLHVYDPPAEGRWLDNVIPGKLAALDRQNGDVLWVVPCEVGYGRGFGAGFGEERDVVVLGPGQVGHRIARMALSSGAVLGVQPTPEFDVALVAPDLCLCVGPRAVRAIVTTTMAETWKFGRADERYHLAARDGDRVHVVASNRERRLQGLLTLDVAKGRLVAEPLAQKLRVVHGIAAGAGCLVLVVDDLVAALPEEEARQAQLARL
ncbi:MAG TPA: hypothetical protein VJP77_03195, partial [Planctomycetota bacterium]|nr:hypothetical protein [Planctomycetota bacterium]